MIVTFEHFHKGKWRRETVKVLSLLYIRHSAAPELFLTIRHGESGEYYAPVRNIEVEP